ncbi:hypothetical protein JHK87_001080 [Glycine soja]|nr:hypothetical protein JHK87_001080 [Glycine soja]
MWYLYTVQTGMEGLGLTVAQQLWYCIATIGGIVTTVLGYDVLLLHRFGVSGAFSLLLLCNDMVVSLQND